MYYTGNISYCDEIQMNKLLLIRCCCCCSHINSHNQVRGHRTGSSHSGAEEYPREKHTKTKVVHAYITADAIHASTRNIRPVDPDSYTVVARGVADLYP